MWSSEPTRRALLIGAAALGAAALGGCGFAPAYAPGGAGNLVRGRIEAAPPSGPLEFAFVERLEARLGRAADAPFVLAYEIDTTDDGLAITADQETQRYYLGGRIDWRVLDRDTQAVLASGRFETFTAYSAIGTTVATRASQTDAIRRLATILADRMVTELIATAGTWAG
jgi:LPS-assembly lipoprotein